MSTSHALHSREEIQREFSQLLRKHEAQAAQISTKAEEAMHLEHRELVERSSAYTVESIVNGLARLQLGFGSAVDEIAGKLEAESGKLGELRRAISVEREGLEELRGTVVAAESLAILEQERRHELAAFEEQAERARTTLADEIDEVRARWRHEAQELERATREYRDVQAKEREEAEEGQSYERARRAEVEANESALELRDLERKLADEGAVKDKDWSSREKDLAARIERIEPFRARVAGFDEELDQAAKVAREKAIASVHRDAKLELELDDKEQLGSVKVFELQVETLGEQIARQAALIVDLDAKLDSTIAKSQSLAEQAFQRPNA